MLSFLLKMLFDAAKGLFYYVRLVCLKPAGFNAAFSKKV
ncbi:hypothetical protein X474_12760 [Dethiosulfatarculus sandiegensis]|uniref:Uncharacterized protein n=1 Tax=Dethiosulfatarculus sandiegensis TaxID=1429043 RepID=A0A0D2J723_9BACT|nr:hypothetical protein X474_12760 [Dethiosulfatarculus sandiegensis]